MDMTDSSQHYPSVWAIIKTPVWSCGHIDPQVVWTVTLRSILHMGCLTHELVDKLKNTSILHQMLSNTTWLVQFIWRAVMWMEYLWDADYQDLGGMCGHLLIFILKPQLGMIGFVPVCYVTILCGLKQYLIS